MRFPTAAILICLLFVFSTTFLEEVSAVNEGQNHPAIGGSGRKKPDKEQSARINEARASRRGRLADGLDELYQLLKWSARLKNQAELMEATVGYIKFLREELIAWKNQEKEMENIRENFFAYLTQLEQEYGLELKMKQFIDFNPSSALAELVNKYLEEGVAKVLKPRTPAFNPQDKQAVRKRKNRDRENKARESLQAMIPELIYRQISNIHKKGRHSTDETIFAAIAYIKGLKFLQSHFYGAKMMYMKMFNEFQQYIDQTLLPVFIQHGIETAPLPMKLSNWSIQVSNMQNSSNLLTQQQIGPSTSTAAQMALHNKGKKRNESEDEEIIPEQGGSPLTSGSSASDSAANTGNVEASSYQMPGTVDVESVNRPSSANPAIVELNPPPPTGNSEELMKFMTTLPELF